MSRASAPRRFPTSPDPLVSVILPTYNQERFVLAAVESVLEQDHRNLQLVIRDDGSSDRTPELLAALAGKDPRIELLPGGTNVGVTAGCNRLLRACRGRYVAFFAGDDLFLPGKLSAQVAWMEADPARVLCYHDVEVFDSDSGRTLYLHSSRSPMGARTFLDLLREPAMFASVSVMLRRECVPGKGYDERLRTASDYLFFLEALLARGPRHPGAGFVPGVWARYRRHAGNVTNQVDDYALPELLEMFAALEAAAPTEAVAIGRARSERLATFGFRRLLAGRPGEGLSLLATSLAHSPHGLARALRNAVRYYLKRAPRRPDRSGTVALGDAPHRHTFAEGR